MSDILFFFIAIALAYVSGSISSAILVSRLFSLPDPRSEGSKNPGATNVLRLAGKQYAGIVLLFDLLKGAVPVLFAQHVLHVGPATLGFTCLFAVAGHIWPIFFGFHGGKGVATAIGTLFGLQFMLGVVVIAIWLIVAYFFRYASLASITALSFAPLISIVSVRSADVFIPLFVISFIILYQHRHNINRLIDGEEPKLSLTTPLPEMAEVLSNAASMGVTEKTSKAPRKKSSSTRKKTSKQSGKK